MGSIVRSGAAPDQGIRSPANPTSARASAVPKNMSTMKSVRSKLPWWVAPGLGAALGSVVIALAAQGSLAGERVSLPAGPRLTATSGAAPSPTAPAPAPTSPDGVVTPVLPVVTQTDEVAPSPVTWHGGPASATSGASSGAPASGVVSTTAGPSESGGSQSPAQTVNSGGTTTATTEDPGTPTLTQPTTTTTTKPPREPRDT